MDRHVRPLYIAVCLTLALLLSGCARRYKITLTNGNVITTKGRPKKNEAENTFQYKNVDGTKSSVPQFRVKEIEPLH